MDPHWKIPMICRTEKGGIVLEDGPPLGFSKDPF